MIGLAGHLAAVRELANAKALRRRSTVPRAVYPDAIEREYAAALLAIAIDREELQRVIDGQERLDAPSKKILAAMSRAVSGTKISAKAATRKAAEKAALMVNDHAAAQLSRQTKAVFGLAMPGVVDLKTHVDQFIAENVALVESLRNKVKGDLWKLVTRAAAEGRTTAQIAAEIEKIYKVGANHARLIARDQIGKVYGLINVARMKSLGVRRFIWRTRQDDRVRPKHRARERRSEKVPYRFDRPPQGVLPGQEIACRCVAEPFLWDVASEAKSPDLTITKEKPKSATTTSPRRGHIISPSAAPARGHLISPAAR